jgi:hypothetical protein
VLGVEVKDGSGFTQPEAPGGEPASAGPATGSVTEGLDENRLELMAQLIASVRDQVSAERMAELRSDQSLFEKIARAAGEPAPHRATVAASG